MLQNSKFLPPHYFWCIFFKDFENKIYVTKSPLLLPTYFKAGEGGRNRTKLDILEKNDSQIHLIKMRKLIKNIGPTHFKKYW